MHPNLLLQIYHKQLTYFMKKSHDLRAKDLKLVSYVANKYRGDPNYIISMLDKIQEGNLRFLQQKDNYDPELNHEFSTFIVWAIRSGVLDVMKTIDTVRIPPHQKEELLKSYKKSYSGIYKSLFVSTHAQTNKDSKGKPDFRPKDDEYLKSRYNNPEETTATNAVNNLVNNELLTKLPKLEKQAIKLRFNLVQYTSKKNHNRKLLPYERIGAIMKISHQSARILCLKALKNLKRYSIELQIEKDAYL